MDIGHMLWDSRYNPGLARIDCCTHDQGLVSSRRVAVRTGPTRPLAMISADATPEKALDLLQQQLFFEKRVQKIQPCANVLADKKTWQRKMPRNAI